MKYDYKKNHYRNLDAWEQHWLNNPRTEFKSLKENEKVALQNLNELLRQLEDKFYPILVSKKRELDSRVDDPSNWMREFNLEYVITFYLREDDPEYEEEDDNILCEIHEYVFSKYTGKNDWGFGATNVDHAVFEAFPGELHCYTYHQLYDHSYLDWRDLLRIGSLYVEIKIEEQSGSLQLSPINEFITSG